MAKKVLWGVFPSFICACQPRSVPGCGGAVALEGQVRVGRVGAGDVVARAVDGVDPDTLGKGTGWVVQIIYDNISNSYALSYQNYDSLL